MKQTNTAYYENLFISQENVHNVNIENFQIIANKKKKCRKFQIGTYMLRGSLFVGKSTTRIKASKFSIKM